MKNRFESSKNIKIHKKREPKDIDIRQRVNTGIIQGIDLRTSIDPFKEIEIRESIDIIQDINMRKKIKPRNVDMTNNIENSKNIYMRHKIQPSRDIDTIKKCEPSIDIHMRQSLNSTIIQGVDFRKKSEKIDILQDVDMRNILDPSIDIDMRLSESSGDQNMRKRLYSFSNKDTPYSPKVSLDPEFYIASNLENRLHSITKAKYLMELSKNITSEMIETSKLSSQVARESEPNLDHRLNTCTPAMRSSSQLTKPTGITTYVDSRMRNTPVYSYSPNSSQSRNASSKMSKIAYSDCSDPTTTSPNSSYDRYSGVTKSGHRWCIVIINNTIAAYGDPSIR